MPDNDISLSFVKEYETSVHIEYQCMGSKLRNTVRTKNVTQGATTVFQKIGKGSASTKARHGKVPVMSVDHEPVECTPGTIIPKAVGSKGLTPLEAPGKFDISQIMLNELRGRIRRALLVDSLGETESPRMTATEVLERSSQMARLLGATYGRLQSELLTPLVLRAVSILARRGLLPDLPADGTLIDLQYTAPLARAQARQEARNTLMWLGAIKDLGPQALASVNAVKTARWLARAYSVPDGLVNEDGAAALQAGAEAQGETDVMEESADDLR